MSNSFFKSTPIHLSIELWWHFNLKKGTNTELCVKLTLAIFFLLSQEKAFRTRCFTSTPSKSLSGPLTGSVIGLFVLCQACHSADQPPWGHSSGDSLLSKCLAEELTEKWQPQEAHVCVCMHPVWVCETDVLGSGHLLRFAPQHVLT